MKSFFYSLLIVLMALPAAAYGQNYTPRPDILIENTQDLVEVTVVGEGTLNIYAYKLEGDNIYLIEEVQAEESYTLNFERTYDEGYHFIVTATAQLDGLLPSESITAEFVVEPYRLLPLPEIAFYEDTNGLTVEVTNGNDPLQVSISSNGENIFNGEYNTESMTYYIEKSTVEQEIEVEAVNKASWPGEIAQTATAYYYLPAFELPFAMPPMFLQEAYDDYFTVTASSDEDGAEVHLFLNDEEVENPYTIMRTDEDQHFMFKAYAEVPGLQRSDWADFATTVPAREPEPFVEKTMAPTMSLEILEDIYGRYYALVTITQSEPSQIHYMAYFLEDGVIIMEGTFDQDSHQFVFNEPGTYRVLAQATADGKETSEWSGIEFVLTQPPTPIYLYDFKEDGIFYKITSEGKVSVCSETRAYNAYSGDVSIPATVTHDGVTYMVTAIDDNAFRDCPGLTSVSIGAYVTSIGNDAFMDCKSLTSVTLGDYVISLGSGAFDGCTSLATVKMGSGLARIGENAFSGCGELTDIYCKAATPPVMASNNCFETDTYGTATLHVYPAVLDSYRGNDYWNQFNNIVGEDNVAPAAGDVNGDGTMSVGDVTTLIHLLLSGE